MTPTAKSVISLRYLGREGRNTLDSIAPTCILMDVITPSGDIRWRLVVDCGLVPSSDGEAYLPNLTALGDGRKIDAVFITHLHTDHVGALPLLIPYLGPRARIYLSDPTFVMLEHMLDESLKISRGHGHEIYSEEAIDRVIKRLTLVTAEAWHNEAIPGVPFYVNPEGHINGACSYTLRLDDQNIHVSGDRCEHDQIGIHGAAKMPSDIKLDIIAGSDCTSGADPDSDGRTWPNEMKRAISLALTAALEGRPVVIFALAMHRSTVIAHALEMIQGLGHFPRIPVYMLGSGVRYTEASAAGKLKWSRLDEPMSVPNTMLMLSRGERELRGLDRPEGDRIDADPRGKIYIATPGMGGPRGAGIQLRNDLLGDPNALMMFTSYVAPGTDGALIINAAKARARTGLVQTVTFQHIHYDREGQAEVVQYRDRPVRCQVEHTHPGAHQSRRELLEWLGRHQPRSAVLTHGSPDALRSLAYDLRYSSSTIHSELDGLIQIPL